ncbi:hypothetical protein IT084_05400 [Desulfallas sp. Bu1-1]|nr:hypothetical protein [Desulfallas sp. Bu1-1]MBF7082414.1 hypothetical protein [Desulfallas sp. Bu1-1]
MKLKEELGWMENLGAGRHSKRRKPYAGCVILYSRIFDKEATNGMEITC